VASRRSRASRRRINSGLLRSSYLFGIGRWKFNKNAHSLARSECCYRRNPGPARARASAPRDPQKRRCSAEKCGTRQGGVPFFENSPRITRHLFSTPVPARPRRPCSLGSREVRMTRRSSLQLSLHIRISEVVDFIAWDR
jgi:hypothetical protein